VDNPKELTVLSLCTGYGGLELGLSRALANSLRVVAVEIEAYALANLVAKAEGGKLAIEALWPDLKTFPAERFRGCFDFILAGYPCQPFSVAGQRKGTDDPRHLWPHIARIVQAVEPLWCFFENVAGHLTLGFPEVYRSLRDMGYSVEAGLFTASECGAPHKRQRLFILANRAGFKYRQRCGNESSENETLKIRRPIALCERTGTWPSRPGQPQYDWEEPRTVANAEQRRRGGSNGEPTGQGRTLQAEGPSNLADAPNSGAGQDQREVRGCPTRNGTGIQGQGDEEAQSRLGGTANGSTYPLDIAKGIRGGYLTKPGGEAGHNLVLEAKMRVDRLRLCGNGVVPQQAELAFRTLIELQHTTLTTVSIV